MWEFTKLQPGDILLKHEGNDAVSRTIRRAQHFDNPGGKYNFITHVGIATGNGTTLIELNREGISSASVGLNKKSNNIETGPWKFRQLAETPTAWNDLSSDQERAHSAQWTVFRYKESETASKLIEVYSPELIEGLIKRNVVFSEHNNESVMNFKNYCEICYKKLESVHSDRLDYRDEYRSLAAMDSEATIKCLAALRALAIRELASEIATSIADGNIEIRTTHDLVNFQPSGSYDFFHAALSVIGRRWKQLDNVSDRQIRRLEELLNQQERSAPTTFFCSNFVVYVYALASFIASKTGDRENIDFAIDKNLVYTTPSQLCDYLFSCNDWVLMNPSTLDKKFIIADGQKNDNSKAHKSRYKKCF